VSSKRCQSGKKKYRSADLAKSVMLEMRRKELPGAEYLHVYRCPLCHRHHLGKTNVPQDEKILLPKKIAARKRHLYDAMDVKNFFDAALDTENSFVQP
jgi:hypothetical protein